VIASLDDFLEACAAWTPDSATKLPEILAWALDNVVLQNDLAAELEVAPSVVAGWARGDARPNPQIQAFIVATLKRRAEAKKGAKAS
jgi:predicted transcriptional regulator